MLRPEALSDVLQMATAAGSAMAVISSELQQQQNSSPLFPGDGASGVCRRHQSLRFSSPLGKSSTISSGCGGGERSIPFRLPCPAKQTTAVAEDCGGVDASVESEQITPALPWGVSPVQVRSQPISMAIPLAHEPPALPIEAPQDSTEQHSTASQTPHSTSSDDFVSSPVVVVPPAQPDPPLDDSDNGPAGEEVALFPDTYHLSNVNPVGGFAATIT
nr:hypothetical protein Iba_chr07bCG7640 [Ipomoea batatas]